MTTELISIEKIIKLDKERTQGEWIKERLDSGNVCIFKEYSHLPNSEESILKIHSDDLDLLTNWENDTAFIAAAPRIAAKAIELDKMLTELNQNMESMQQTNQALLKKLGAA